MPVFLLTCSVSPRICFLCIASQIAIVQNCDRLCFKQLPGLDLSKTRAATQSKPLTIYLCMSCEVEGLDKETAVLEGCTGIHVCSELVAQIVSAHNSPKRSNDLFSAPFGCHQRERSCSSPRGHASNRNLLIAEKHHLAYHRNP